MQQVGEKTKGNKMVLVLVTNEHAKDFRNEELDNYRT